MMFVRSKATARAAAAGQQRTAAAPVARRTQQRIVRARAAEEESAPAGKREREREQFWGLGGVRAETPLFPPPFVA